MLHLEHFHTKQSVEYMYSAFGICDTITKPLFTVNSLGLSYRTVNYWDKNNLLLSERKSEKAWRKFSFIDFIWINMIQDLRDFGFSTKTIHKIKALCTEPVPERILKTISLKEHIVQPASWSPTFLTNIMAELVRSRNHISIIYNTEGEIYVHFLGKENQGITHSISYLNYVCFSLSEIYLRFLQKTDTATIKKLKIFPEDFIRVTDELKQGVIESISFLYAGNESEISQEYYGDESEFIRDCLRLLTTTNYDNYRVTYSKSSEGHNYNSSNINSNTNLAIS